MRAVNELPVSVEPVVEHVVDRIGLRLDYGTRVERRGRAPLVLMTQRIRLDEHLAHQAAAAGADFRDGVKVTDIVADDAGASAACRRPAGGGRRARRSGRRQRPGAQVAGPRWGVRARRGAGGQRRQRGRRRALPGDRRARAGRHPRRLRLGLPEGRSRERRRRRLGERGPHSPRPAGRALQATRHRGRGRGVDPRPSAAAPQAGLDRRARSCAARRRRRRSRRPAVGRRDVRGVRERAPRLRGRARAARRDGRLRWTRTRRRWRRRSDRSCLPRGAPRSRSTATHARRLRSAARRSRGA